MRPLQSMALNQRMHGKLFILSSYFNDLHLFSNGPFITGLRVPLNDLLQDRGEVDHLLGVDLVSDEEPAEYVLTFHIILPGLTTNVEMKLLMR